MTELSLQAAQTILTAALAKGRALNLKPLAVAVLDAHGSLKAFAAEDGTSLKRGAIAVAKASGAMALGVGSRAIEKLAKDRPHFVAAASHVIGGGGLVPVPGGVLVLANGALVGAVGVSGDTSDNDEIAAMAGIEAAGLKGDGGSN
ncbi:MAG: GlcG/HbpS family heme-binding protein [Alphaproteobacteria bacterium]